MVFRIIINFYKKTQEQKEIFLSLKCAIKAKIIINYLQKKFKF